MVFYISGPKLLFETTEIDSTGVKLYIFIHNEVQDFDKNSTKPEIRVNRVRDNESQLYDVCLFIVFNATFNNILAISWQSVLLVEETRRKPQTYCKSLNHISANENDEIIFIINQFEG
jgi:hypothetical protein